ncbi:MAG: hypothetical protein IPK32_25480 [Verrucomicrobiaceae bacterium]|nr:hypothetical protein [Verrucomicrobiaceae bacterium]
MFQALHLLLFILLPLALTLRAALHRNGDALTESTSALYFCLGIAKAVLLVIPLMEISLLILHAGAANVSLSAAWVCVLALALFIGLFISSVRDVATGLSGLFGVQPSTIEKKAPLSRSRSLLMLLAVVLGMMLALTLSLSEWAHFIKALIWPPPRSISVLIQDARVWTDYHILSLAASAAIFFLTPPTTEFLRVWRPWKAIWSLSVFALAAVMLWTRYIPVS